MSAEEAVKFGLIDEVKAQRQLPEDQK